jgi:hypothetical protein
MNIIKILYIGYIICIINIVHNIFIQNFVNCKYYFTVLFLQCMEIIMNVEFCYEGLIVNFSINQ